jgi:predicted dehydrogenase
VGVGFIGAGNVLPAYLQALDRLVPRGLALEGPVCARRREVWPALERRRPGIRLVETPEDVIDAPDVDLVAILTPPAPHAELTRAALAAGRHVLVEKPLAASAGEAAALFESAQSAGLLLVAAPFVQLSPTFRRLWTLVRDGAIGSVHAARAHYGNPGSTWAAWYHQDPAATLGDVGVYNLKSLATLLGPIVEVQAASVTAVTRRTIGGSEVDASDPDTWQLVLRHQAGALSSVLASHVTWRYRRPAIELYGTEGSANLIGDDWDPQGIEVYREATGSWELIEPDDATWLWTDGLREAVAAIKSGREPLADPELDVHLLEVIEAVTRAAAERRAVQVESSFSPLESLRHDAGAGVHVHDRTRAADEQ